MQYAQCCHIRNHKGGLTQQFQLHFSFGHRLSLGKRASRGISANTYSIYRPGNQLFIQPGQSMARGNTTATMSHGCCAYRHPVLHPRRSSEQTKSSSNPGQVDGKSQTGKEKKECLQCFLGASFILVMAATIASGPRPLYESLPEHRNMS